MTVPDLSTREGRERLRAWAERIIDSPALPSIRQAGADSLAVLDALDAAEAERDYRRRENEELSVALNLALTGEEVQTGERYSNAVALAQAVLRADRAEAALQRVRDVVDLHGPSHDEPDQDEADCGPQIIADLRRALDGD